MQFIIKPVHAIPIHPNSIEDAWNGTLQSHKEIKALDINNILMFTIH